MGNRAKRDPLLPLSRKFSEGTVQTCQFLLSADKKKFTNKCVAKSPDGKESRQTIVYDRTK